MPHFAETACGESIMRELQLAEIENVSGGIAGSTVDVALLSWGEMLEIAGDVASVAGLWSGSDGTFGGWSMDVANIVGADTLEDGTAVFLTDDGNGAFTWHFDEGANGSIDAYVSANANGYNEYGYSDGSITYGYGGS